MAAFAQTFQQYPDFSPVPELPPLQLAAFDSLAGTDLTEARKLLTCRTRSQCRSIFCPSCAQKAGYQHKHRIFEAASTLKPARLKFGTFPGRDVPLDALREAGQVLMQSARTLCKRLTGGSVIRLEVSDPMTADFHAHVHALLDTPAGGKDFISADTWEAEWRSELPQWLHPVQTGAHVKPVRDLNASSCYLSKSAFTSAKCAEAIRHAVNSIRALKGIPKFSYHGTLN